VEIPDDYPYLQEAWREVGGTATSTDPYLAALLSDRAGSGWAVELVAVERAVSVLRSAGRSWGDLRRPLQHVLVDGPSLEDWNPHYAEVILFGYLEELQLLAEIGWWPAGADRCASPPLEGRLRTADCQPLVFDVKTTLSGHVRLRERLQAIADEWAADRVPSGVLCLVDRDGTVLSEESRDQAAQRLREHLQSYPELPVPPLELQVGQALVKIRLARRDESLHQLVTTSSEGIPTGIGRRLATRLRKHVQRKHASVAHDAVDMLLVYVAPPNQAWREVNRWTAHAAVTAVDEGTKNGSPDPYPHWLGVVLMEWSTAEDRFDCSVCPTHRASARSQALDDLAERLGAEVLPVGPLPVHRLATGTRRVIPTNEPPPHRH
jgi:hypothetical protein